MHLFKCNLYLPDSMNQLQKLFELAKDQGITTNSSCQVVETFDVAYTITLGVQTPVMASDLSIREPSPSPSPIKMNQGECLSISVEGGSSKRVVR